LSTKGDLISSRRLRAWQPERANGREGGFFGQTGNLKRATCSLILHVGEGRAGAGTSWGVSEVGHLRMAFGSWGKTNTFKGWGAQKGDINTWDGQRGRAVG